MFKSDAVKDDKDKPVIRPYTPTSAPDTPGHIDFLIKKYKDGKMTEFVHGMQPGDKLSIKGPIPKFPYKANEFGASARAAGGALRDAAPGCTRHCGDGCRARHYCL